MELALAFGGIFISLGIAFHEHRRANRAEVEVRRQMQALPERVAVEHVLARPQSQPPASSSDERAFPMFTVKYADLDGDGQDELIVTSPAGAHASELRVFGWRDLGFQELGVLGSANPIIRVEDVDGDGRLEVIKHEPDFSTGEPYATAPSIEYVYRWDGQRFVELSSRRLEPTARSDDV